MNLFILFLLTACVAKSTVAIQSDPPSISSVAAPADGTYASGLVLEFSMSFSEDVVVTGDPRLPLILSSGTVYAYYVSGSGTNSLIFRYTINPSDSDSDGIALGLIDLNGGSIKDLVSYQAILNYTSPDTSAILLNINVPEVTSIILPASGHYTTGQNLDFVVNFNQSVIVTSVPRIAITAQSGIIYADYLSGGGTSALTFRYNVNANEYDTNGIVLVSPIETPSISSIKDLALTTNALLTYTLPNTSSILVDGLDPIISSITPPANGQYLLGSNLDFIVNYSTNVTVTGTPHMSMTIGAASVTAEYLSGTGTNALTFRYTVAATNLDVDGVTTSSPLLLNSGSIKDVFGDNASLTFTLPTTTGVKVDTVAPSISSVTASPDTTYNTNHNIDFTAQFSETVLVTGNPRISLMIGGASKSAVYTSGSGTNTLVFRYTVSVGDLDNDGIGSSSPLVLNGGTIKDLATNTLSPLTFTPPTTSGVLVDGTTFINSVVAPLSSTYKTANNVDFVLSFSNPVTVTGTPRIQLNVGGATAFANYFSGSTTTSLIFRYTVGSGDSDTNGLALTSPLSLNSGTIVDSVSTNATLTFTLPDTSGVLIDGVSPSILSITPGADKTYANAETLDFSVAYNYNTVVTGTPRIQLTVGASTLYATYLSGSGTSTLVFRYTIGGTDLDTDGVTTVGPNLDLNSGTIKDEFGDNANLAFTGSNYPNKKVDGVRPTISNMAVSVNNTYISGENIDFTATYSEAVTFTGAPRLDLTVGITSRYATYFSGSGTNTIVFRYTVQAGDFDDNGISLATLIDLNSGTISDANTNQQTTLSFSAPTLTGVLVGGVDPTIISINPPASQTYLSGAQLDFTVNFSENVTITGTPTLSLNVGATTVQASYVSGSGTSAIVFRYNVLADHYDADGLATASPLLLAGGSIKSSTSTANANLTFTGSVQTGVIIDADVPRISSITLPANFAYQNGHGTATRQYLQFTANIDKAVTVTGTPRLILTVGPNTTAYANYVSAGSTSTALIFKYNIATTDIDLNGITFGNSNNFDLNGGTIKGSTAANDLDPALGTNVMTKIFVVPTGLRAWYDVSDASYRTGHVGAPNTRLTALNDKIATYNLTATGIDYAQSGFNSTGNAYLSCASTTAGDYLSSATTYTGASGIITAFKAPSAGSSTQILIGNSGNTQGNVVIQLRDATTLRCGTAGPYCQVYSSTSGTGWTTDTVVQDYSGKFTLNGYSAVATKADWSIGSPSAPPTGVTYAMCKMVGGEIAETFLLNETPVLTVAQLEHIRSYFMARYGFTFTD